MTKYSVDLEELAGVAEEVKAFQTLFEQRLGQLEKLVSDLHLTWHGQAAAAHLQAHQQWATGAKEMHEGISDMHRAATTAHDNYHSAGTSNADMLRRTR